MTSKIERYLPLYEAKMMHQFTHRWATYQPNGKTRDMTLDELRDADAVPLPRYWVDEREVEARLEHWDRGWLLGFRDVTNTTNERTGIFSVIPISAVGHAMPLMYVAEADNLIPAILSGFDNLPFDYSARQKVGGIHLTYGYLKQLPVIPSHTYTPALLDFIRPRVLELTYTAWDLQPFARDLGYDGPPFVWDDERRFLMRCELDALYFRLYGIERADVDYIMDTFPIVKRKDKAAQGEYRTKRVILELYDQMAGLPTMLVPAPKEEQGEIEAPDLSQWVTPLEPPPADPRAAHVVE
ncbi:MAG: restriction endonuclease [Anaerolineae bacterium]|nr:restriction endonuclease [Anaerolineae bacterium]